MADQGMRGDDYPDQAARAAALNEDDERVLRVWRESLVLQDPRYKSKVLLKFAAVSMADADFRARLINDLDGVLGDFRSGVDWPEGLTLRFFENTEDTLNVVLPPRAGQTSTRPPALRDVLRSRTTADAGFLKDDFDIGDFDQIDMFGDEDERDHPSFPPHVLPS
jgi:hypothetical protein